MTTLKVLRDCADAVSVCTSCDLYETREHTVFDRWQQKRGPMIMFVGESPEGEEDACGIPFVGPGGKLLDEIITKFGIEDYYITNTVKCWTPVRAPTDAEREACEPYLAIQIVAVAPTVIVALGKTAALSLGCDVGPGWAGRWGQYDGVPVMPTYHPAQLLAQDDPRRLWKLVVKHMRAATRSKD